MRSHNSNAPYRIAQEALNNAVKHSGARNIWVTLAAPEVGIELKIQDDGKGIEHSAYPNSGMGLYIMDYRARSLGGELRLESAPGKGTLLDVLVPLP